MTDAVRLQSHVIDGPQPGPHLLITGGVHGDEWEPMVAIRRLMRLPELAEICGKLTLVPVVNEAAFARGNRVAEDGLDLARTCPGKPDGSITERTAHALSQLIRTADYYIDLHTGGTALTVFPLAGYMLHPRADVLAKQRLMGRAFGLPIVWGTDWRLEGRSLSVARDANVPAIYCEYLGGGGCSPAGVEAYVAGCLNVMKVVGTLRVPSIGTDSPFSNDGTRSVPTTIEDSRPNSGHMQRCYPSPMAGCFETAVELGQAVEVGQPLGWVVNPLGRERREVLSTQAGLVIVLRTFPSVKAGDSLAVILEQPPTEELP
jgi:predicted deacylase